MNSALAQLFQTLIGKIILGQLRHYVTIAGTAVVAKGLWDNSQATQAEGAVLTLIPLLLSAYSKWKEQQAANQAAQDAVNAKLAELSAQAPQQKAKS